VVRMAWQVEPVDAPTARIPHARFGPCGSRAGFGTPVDSAGATASARPVAIDPSSGSIPQ
ncbi:hypothetical protein M3583_25350, partial [Bacillus subtilis]|nr:hypothetical protein [Bacillus subtilis]